ncbi:MAG TPA: serine hydrolase, partial [Anaerolineales bacterium]|nr:serine hydrolase [Anaerolineales bacterium]
MKRLQVPSVAIGVWHKGKEYTAGFGVTSIEHPLLVTPDTLFQTGSISIHPYGLPHGPQPGMTEASIGKKET